MWWEVTVHLFFKFTVFFKYEKFSFRTDANYHARHAVLSTL